MTEGEPYSIAIVCEDEPDRRMVCTLIDRILGHERDRSWFEFEGRKFLKISTVRDKARERKIKAHGHFNGEPAEPDAQLARLALLLFVGTDPQPNAVAFVRDSDDDLRRRKGCEQARKAEKWPFEILLGVAHTKRECWILAAYDPADDEGHTKLKEIRKKLGFDPRLHSHKLTAKHGDDTLSAKRVLSELVEDDESCWSSADLDQLKKRGKQNGLFDFINEIVSRLLPHFAGKPQ